MKKRTDRWRAAVACIALCGVLTACGQKEKVQDLTESGITAEASEGENDGGSGGEPERILPAPERMDTGSSGTRRLR